MTVTNPKLFEEWKREIELNSTALKCPYIIQIYGFCATPTNLSIVMELAARGTLYLPLPLP